MFIDNSWYSHRKIFADYCNVKNKPIFGTIQHGWITFLKNEWKFAKLSKLKKASFFCWNYKIKKNFKRNKISNVICIGAPFIYIKKNKKKFKKRNLLIFPCHSDNRNIKKLINHHQNIIYYGQTNYEPNYSVCLFYKDNKKEIVDLYLKNNWKVFCCGNRYNQTFLYKLQETILRHKNIVVNEFTSAYLYSLYLKKKTKIVLNYKINKKNYNFKNSWVNIERKTMTKNQIKELKNQYKIFLNDKISQNKKRELALYELGIQHKKSKKEIINLFGWDNAYKQLIAYIWFVINFFLYRLFIK